MGQQIKVPRWNNFCGHREGVSSFFCDWELEISIKSSCGDGPYFNLDKIPSHNTKLLLSIVLHIAICHTLY